MRHTYKKLKTLLKYCELKSASSHSLPQPFSVPLTPSQLLSPFSNFAHHFPISLTLSQFPSPLPNFPLYFFSVPLTFSPSTLYPFPISLNPFQFSSTLSNSSLPFFLQALFPSHLLTPCLDYVQFTLFLPLCLSALCGRGSFVYNCNILCAIM